MSMQQINLYQAGFQKEKLVVSAQQVFFTLVGIIVLMGGAIIFNAIRLAQMESDLEMVKTEQTQKFAHLETLQKQVQSRNKDKKLLNEIEVLTTEISNKQKVLQILTDEKFGNTRGFTEQVKGLARQRIEGMWLTGISITDGGKHLGLSGQATKAKLLPQYLQKLSSENIFMGKVFETLKMQRDTENKSWLNFDLRSITDRKGDNTVQASGVNPESGMQ